MNLVGFMKGVYRQLSQDETLLRLLHYVPVNQDDNPLDPSKPNILELPIEERFKIIDQVLYEADKKFKLDLKSKFSRINFYLNERNAERVYSRGAGRLVTNPMVSKQELVIDIHTNIEINKMDFRMYSIIERIQYLLNKKNYCQFTGLLFSNGYTIINTPDGFLGYRLVYYCMTPQQMGC